MIILFVNVQNNTIELYSEEGIVRIPFVDVGKLYNYVEEDSSILYITNAVQTTPIEVINMIKGMGVTVSDNIPVDTGLKYLYSPSEGTIYINEYLKFEGKFDIKLIDEEMTTTIQNNNLLKQLIKNKKIEIIGEIKKTKLMQSYKDNKQSVLEKQKKIDAGLDSIIVQTSVEDAKRNGIITDTHADAEEIDILGAGSVSDAGGPATMSELTNAIEDLEG